jgi:hypothetical protein
LISAKSCGVESMSPFLSKKAILEENMFIWIFTL